MDQLTPKQQRVYDFIRQTIEARQMPPTRADIAKALGFRSANAAQAHLRTLEHKGLIALDRHRSRGIRLAGDPPPDPATLEVPADEGMMLAVIGRVAAGAPILAVDHVERHCRVDTALFRERPDYLLRVRGDSMTGAGILDNDLLAVRIADEVQPNEIAVFRRDDEVTVKRFRPQGRWVRLVAENPSYEDILVDTVREALSLEGVAIGVLRAY